MNVAFLNAVAYGSTWRIVESLADALQKEGHRTLTAAGFTWKKSTREDFVLTSGIVEKTIHTYRARFTGKIGTYSKHATRKLLRRLDEFSPDVIHLHNLHGWYLNLPMLFDYIKKNRIRVLWTLHDCWAFTGHCPHFDACGCEKWKSGCHHCSQHRLYPQSYVDASEAMYENKKRWFCGVEDLTVITPSEWLASLVRESFLKEYPVRVIHNGIDLSVFCPSNGELSARYADPTKHTVLGVSYAWNEKKGLDVFCSLSERLGEKYRILLVGTDEKVEETLPNSILPIRRTQNARELAELYTLSDVFVNPTREENYPTVNMEAIACGTPVITFATGGSPEIPDETSGESVPKNDVDTLVERIRVVCETKPYTKEACLIRAKEFDHAHFIRESLALYREETNE